MSDIVLKTENLTKRYGGVHALEGANFELRKGEHVAIMGDNGAGKSNLFLGREKVLFNLGPFSILDRKYMRKATEAALVRTAVKIPNLSNTIRHMSGGQRQCVAIARTATFASKLIIMDEPTAALGVQETAQVENIIRTLKDNGEPLILISHNMRQV
ncbi:MAG: sugar ABC transporter ATP-binding protein, partial [Mesorhizobium sp.]